MQGGADAFNEDSISLNTTPPTSSTNQFLSSLDLQQLEAIGFNVRRPTPPHLKFNITYDPSVDAAPAAFKTEVEAVAKHFEGLFLDPVTINLTVAFNPLDPNVLGQSQPSSLTSFSYNTIRAALANKAGSADDATAALLATDSISGAHNYLLPTAEQKALGLLENYPSPDGTVTFSSTANFDYSGGKNIAANSYDFTGVVADEFSQIMGRTMDVGTTDANFLNNVGVANNVPSSSQYPGFPNSYTLLDLYHYSAPGTRDFSPTPGYFSIDGGNTNLNNFDATAGDDPGNWAATVHNDAFGVSISGHTEPVTPVDLRELGILGWDSLSNVSKAAELSTDIKKIDLASQATGGDGTDYIITLAPGATLTEAADLFAVNLAGNDTLTIDGQGATLDGGGAHRGLFVYAGNVTIENLTIANAVARGGAGGDGGGGGGAGFGGGLFLANGAQYSASAATEVTLNNVNFSNDAAQGGAGGNGSNGAAAAASAATAPPAAAAVDGGGGGGGGVGRLRPRAQRGRFSGGGAAALPGSPAFPPQARHPRLPPAWGTVSYPGAQVGAFGGGFGPGGFQGCYTGGQGGFRRSRRLRRRRGRRWRRRWRARHRPGRRLWRRRRWRRRWRL